MMSHEAFHYPISVIDDKPSRAERSLRLNMIRQKHQGDHLSWFKDKAGRSLHAPYLPSLLCIIHTADEFNRKSKLDSQSDLRASEDCMYSVVVEMSCKANNQLEVRRCSGARTPRR
jgi:hypothetical protein